MTVSSDQEDNVLLFCNETELIQIAKKAGLGHLKRGIPKDVLIGIVQGEIEPGPEHLSGTTETRQWLERALGAPDPVHGRPPGPNWLVVRSQLPGCNGLCTRYDCSEGKHANCYIPNVNNPFIAG